jgi:hypothetical protein
MAVAVGTEWQGQHLAFVLRVLCCQSVRQAFHRKATGGKFTEREALGEPSFLRRSVYT